MREPVWSRFSILLADRRGTALLDGLMREGVQSHFASLFTDVVQHP